MAGVLRNGVGRVERIASGLPAPLRQLGGMAVSAVKAVVGSVSAVATDRPLVGLTFDDGPDPLNTPAILEVLEHHEVRATFFMLTERAEAHPAVVQRVIDSGHEIALHGRNHDLLTRLPLRDLIDRIWRGKQLLERASGVPVRLYRPPYGEQNLRSVLVARASRLDVVVWSADGNDWEDVGVEAVVVRAVGQCRPGAVLLLHDSYCPHPDRPAPPPRFDRALALDGILTGLDASGLGAVPVGEIRAKGRDVLKVWL